MKKNANDTKNIPLKDKIKQGASGIRVNAANVELVKRYLAANTGKVFMDIGELFFYLLEQAENPPANNNVSEIENKLLLAQTANERLQKELSEEKEKYQRYVEIIRHDIEVLTGERQRLEAENKKSLTDFNDLHYGIRTHFGEYMLATDMTFIQMLERGKNELVNLRTENETLKAGAPAIDFSIFEDERLKGFAAFRKPEHEHPFDTLKEMKTLADESIIDYEKAKFELETEPLRVLEPGEYDFFKKWVNETFIPAMRANLQMPDLILTARHQFMLMFDYCFADPVTEVLAMFPNATAEQKAKLEDMQFPRASAVVQVLNDITEKINEHTDATAQLVETETGKIIDINRTGANGTNEPDADPAADNQNGNQPQQ